MYEDVDLITEDLITESGSNSMSLIILTVNFVKKKLWTSNYGFMGDY